MGSLIVCSVGHCFATLSSVFRRRLGPTSGLHETLSERPSCGERGAALVPAQHWRDPASVSSAAACHRAFYAWNHLAFRCDGRCEPADPGCRRRRWDRRSVRASGRPAVERSGLSNGLVTIFANFPEVATFGFAVRLGLQAKLDRSLGPRREHAQEQPDSIRASHAQRPKSDHAQSSQADRCFL